MLQKFNNIAGIISAYNTHTLLDWNECHLALPSTASFLS
jgi:hypothetical protein